MNLLRILETARLQVPSMKATGDCDARGKLLYSICWEDPQTGEAHATPPAGQIRTRRFRQELILERAAGMAGGWDALKPLRGNGMTGLEEHAFRVALSKQNRAKGKRLVRDPDVIAKSIRQSARWHATRNANLAKERDRLPPPAPDAGKAMEVAARKIKSAHPNLAPHALQTLARWASGTI